MRSSSRLLLLLLLTLSSISFADQVEVPEEELSSETVLPVFDRRRIVLNRNVQMRERFELGGAAGLALNEPFFEQMNFGLNAGYHFDDSHGMMAYFNSFSTALSGYGEQLKAGEAGNIVFDPSKAPKKKYSLMFNYQFDAYYGKISLTKKGVMNLSLFFTGGAGVLGFDGSTKPGLNFGLGQNFYFTKSFAIRYDLRMLMYNGPDATSVSLQASDSPEAGDFKDEIFFDTLLTVGASFLL